MIAADLCCKKYTLRVCAELDARFGGVDILLNNAAVYQEQTPIIKTTDREWAEMLNLNLRSPFILSRELLPGMIDGAMEGLSISSLQPTTLKYRAPSHLQNRPRSSDRRASG